MIKTNSNYTVLLWVAVLCIVIMFVSGTITFYADSMTLHAQNERSIQNRQDIEKQQQVLFHEKKAINEQIIELQTKVNEYVKRANYLEEELNKIKNK